MSINNSFSTLIVKVFKKTESSFFKDLVYLSFNEDIENPNSELAILFLFKSKYNTFKPKAVYYQNKFWFVSKKDETKPFTIDKGRISIKPIDNNKSALINKLDKVLRKTIDDIVNN